MALAPQHALDRLLEAHAAGRLAHAYLICGPRGCGKTALIEALAARILHTDHAASHPDFHSAEPESKSRRILIEQMRRLEHALRSKPAVGPGKVAVIREADRLQPQAANAFLKTLEEPPPGTHLFLTSSSPDALLETILSRCIIIPLRSGELVRPGGVNATLLDALEHWIARSESPTRAGFALARIFLDVLIAERERIREESEEAFKAEQAHYKQTTDGSWLEERENQLKAAAESAVVRTRSELLQTLAGWFADLLRVQHGAEPSFDRPALRTEASRSSPSMNLRRLQVVEETLSSLDRNVQEALAIEAGFHKLFSIQA